MGTPGMACRKWVQLDDWEERQATLQEELLPVLSLEGQIGISELKKAALFSSRNTSEDCTLTRIECEIF